MNWEAIGAIGEVIGAIGVIVTLAYLAVQIRQNTASLKSSTLQAMLEASAGLHDLCAADPELGRIFIEGIDSHENLTEAEFPRFHFLMMSFLRRLENIYNQGVGDQVAESDWSGIKNSSLDVMVQPGAQEWWRANQSRFNANFAIWVSKGIECNAA